MANGGAVAVFADLRLVEDGLRDVAVIRDRNASGRPHAESDDADAIVLTPRDEIADQLLGHRESIPRPEVLGRHASGSVESHHDVDAVAVVGGQPDHPLRPGQRHDHQQRAGALQNERQPGEARPKGKLRRDERERRDGERSELPAAVADE